jgi:hypothetical protein
MRSPIVRTLGRVCAAVGVRAPCGFDADLRDVPLEVRTAVVVMMAERGESVREAAEGAEGEERDEEGAFHDEFSVFRGR